MNKINFFSNFPKEQHAPKFLKSNEYLKITSGDNGYSVGSYIGITEKIDKNKKYKITVNYKKTDNAKVSAHIFFLDSDKKTLTMEYLKSCGTMFYGECCPVEGAEYIKFEYMFSCFGKEEAEFSLPEIETLDIDKRTVNVATAYFYPAWKRNEAGDINANMSQILRIIDNAGKSSDKPDILCFTETAYDRGTGLSFDKMAVREDCESVKKVCEKAKEHKMHIIFGIHELAKEGIYNTSYVISDEGKILGKHRKTQITYSELATGMLPGRVLEPIETKFGKVGIMICWEQWYPEVARELVKKGAEMLFVCTAGDPVELSRARARENGVYVIVSGTATKGDGESSRIIDRQGNIIKYVTDMEVGFVSHKIDLNEKIYVKSLGVNSNEILHGADPMTTHINESMQNFGMISRE